MPSCGLKILWTDETKTNLSKNDGKSLEKEQLMIRCIITSSVKDGGGSFVAWACMTAKEPRSLAFIDELSADKNSRMSSEVYRAIAQIQPK